MNTRRRLLTLGAAVLAPAWVRAEPAPDALVLANAIYPPLVNPPGHASGEGVDIEIAREALRRGGFEGAIDLQLVPWKRVLFMLEHGTADFTTTANFSTERDRFLRWSTPYRAGVQYHFYTRKGSGLKLQQLEDLRGHRLALSAGFIYPKAVLDMAAGQVEYGRNVGSAVQLVERGRAEVAIVSALAGTWEIHQLGAADALERQPLAHFNPEPSFMAFSKASTRSPAALAAMDAGLASMLRDGSIARIERRYVR
ncbi:MAG: transporter substrate-binding domain-containing protein [Burkholderiales bacterium]|nr:transporter substrate-binding domain-containing protein [Burkholderiales bacterium]